MGEAACDLLAAELALDRLEAALAGELPAHLRAFARAHAAGEPPPPAPAIARHASAIEVVRRALVHPLLADRALGLARLVVPLVIEDDPRVVAARRAVATWEALAPLAAAREASARARSGLGYVALVHGLHGVAHGGVEPAPWPARIDAWHARDRAPAAATIEEVWRLLAARHGAHGRVQLVACAATVRPRAFAVEPQREVIVVVPAVLDTPAARFAALHELGHAVVALAAPAGVPRVVDEAAASYVARRLEDPADRWFSEHAAAARRRRRDLAAALDAVEQQLPLLPAPLPTTHPPWALWHDPGAQAAYVGAEQLADRFWAELGPAPAEGAFARVIAAERARIDRATSLEVNLKSPQDPVTR